MRIKLLRSLGKNLPPFGDDDRGVREALDKDPPWLEGQVRDADDRIGNYLVRNALAEETDEDVTEVPEQPAAKAKAPRGKQQKFPAGTHVEVTDKTLPTHRQTGTVESAAPVSGSGDPFMYTVKRDDGSTFKASEGQLKKA